MEKKNKGKNTVKSSKTVNNQQKKNGKDKEREEIFREVTINLSNTDYNVNQKKKKKKKKKNKILKVILIIILYI